MTDFATLGIRVDSSQVKTGTSALDDFSKAGKRAENSADGLASTLKGLKGLFIGAIGADAARRFVETADAFKNMNSRLLLATRSLKEFTDAQRALFNISQTTRTGLEQTVDLFTSLTRSTESLGASQADVLQVTETINKALVVSGTNAQAAQAALTQLGQGLASGALRGDELNSVLEQAPRLARAIADGLGVSVGKLRELGAEGKITGEKVFQSLQKSTVQINAEFAKMPLTVAQASTQAANSLTVLIGAIDEAMGATSALAESISGTAGLMAELADEIKRASQGDESVGVLALAFQYVSETVKVLYANLVFVYEGIRREIGAVAAQVVALAHLDISGFNAISEAVKEDAARARKELDAYVSSVLVIGRLDFSPNNQSDAEARRLGIIKPVEPRKATGGGGGKPGKGGGKDGIAEALLAAELAAYKRTLAEFTAAFDAEEAILEARRSAGLVDEAAYYAKKTELVNKGADAQVKALEAEKARLAQEKVSGAEAIKNQSRIADLESEILRIRQKSTTETEILAIRQKQAADEVARSLENAAAAAQSYVDTIARANQRDLDGLGKGNLQREIDQRKNQRDDQLQQRKDQLADQLRSNQITEAQHAAFLAIEEEAHRSVLAEDERFWMKRQAIMRDGIRGAQEALANYIDQANNAFERANRLVTDGLQGFNDALTEGLWTGDFSSFKEFGDRIGKQILAGIIEQNATKPLAQWIQGALSDKESPFSQIFGALVGSSSGGASSGAAAASTAAGAAGAATSLTALTVAATSAATALALISANAVGSAGGDALGSFIGSMGWSEGGFTGPGGKYQPAGIVHAGEGVLSQEDVRAIGGEGGFNALRRMIRRGYADGGYVQAIAAGRLTGGSVGGAPTSSRGGTTVIVQAQPGMSHDTALQQGRKIAEGLSGAQQRNG